MGIYDKNFYATNRVTASKSAHEIMPYILNKLKPKSVVDFGCGAGAWLNEVWQHDNNIDILGYDGEWVNIYGG